MTDQTLLKLRELLLNEFTEAELIALSQDIGLSYEALPGAGTFGKTRELVEVARAQDKLRALQSRLRELRPDAYATAGITLVTEGVASTAAASTLQQSASRNGIPRLWVAVPLLLIALFAVLAVATLLPRPVAPSTTTSTTQSTSVPAVANTDQAGTAASTVTPDLGVVTEAAPVVTVESGVIAGLTPETTPAGGDVAPTETPASQPAVETTAIAPSQEATTTLPAAGPSVDTAPNTSFSATHPAAQSIFGLNDQLPLFYTGKDSASDLEQFWTGEALRSVVGFGNTRLPRAMRMQPAQRQALDVTFEYVRQPVLVSQSANSAVVTSREAWRYANSVNTTQICEVRDYVYNMVKQGDSYRVRTFQSRLLDTGCKPQ